MTLSRHPPPSVMHLPRSGCLDPNLTDAVVMTRLISQRSYAIAPEAEPEQAHCWLPSWLTNLMRTFYENQSMMRLLTGGGDGGGGGAGGGGGGGGG